MKKVKLLFAIAVLGIALFSTSSCTRINPGNVGFKYSFGGDHKGIPETEPAIGWCLFTPGFSTVIEFPTSMQHYVWTANSTEGSPANEEIQIACKGGAGFKCDVGFNYTIQPDSAKRIYFKYKTDDLDAITKSYLRNIVRNCMNDQSGVIPLDSLIGNIPLYEASVRSQLKDSLAKDGFQLQLFGLMAPPRPISPDIEHAINDKIKEKQLADQALMTRNKETNLALAKIEKARGDSASVVINALGEAQAIRSKQAVLTKEYVDYIKWLNAGPNVPRVPATMLGSNASILLNQ